MSETLPHETGTDQTGTDQTSTDQTGTSSDAATGHPVVDEVLASLERLEAGPASDHVAVFASAHERLRGALTDTGSGALIVARTGPAGV